MAVKVYKNKDELRKHLDEEEEKRRKQEEEAEKFATEHAIHVEGFDIDKANQMYGESKRVTSTYTSGGQTDTSLWGDIVDNTQTLGATIADFGLNAARGFFSTGEGVVDFVESKAADIGEFFVGENDFSNFMRGAAAKDITGAVFGDNNLLGIENWQNDIQERSLSNDFIDSVGQGLGNILAFQGFSGLGSMAGLTSKGAQVATSITGSYTSAYGNSYTELLRQGVDKDTARKNATINAVAETISEQVFNKIPFVTSAGWGDKAAGRLADSVSKYFKNEALGKLVITMLDGLSEGSEEVISNLISQLGNDILYLFDSSYTLGKENSNLANGYQFGDILGDLWDAGTSKDSINSFLSASLSSFLMSGAKGLTDKHTQNKVINAYAKDNGISFEQAKGILNEMMDNARQEIKDDKTEYNSQVELNEMAQDRILNYMNIRSNENMEAKIEQKIQDEQKENGVTYTPEEIEKRKLELRTIEEDSLNSPRKYQQFTLEKEPTDEKHKVLYESFRKTNRNNTEESHKIYNLLSGLLDANKNSNYQLVNNELLKAQGVKPVKVNGKDLTINGFYKNGVVNVNTDSKNSYEKVVYHEIGHAIKETSQEIYDELANLVYELKGREQLEEYRKLYNVKEGETSSNLTDDYVDEYINDKLGEILQEQKFVDRVTQHKNLVQRLLAEIKRMIKYMASGKEKKKLMDAQKAIEEKFEEGLKNATFKGSEDTQLSISQDSQGRELSQEQQEYFKDSKVRDDNGNLLTLYHNTDKDFNEFNPDYYGKNTGEKLRGIYLSPEPLGSYGDRSIEAYANITNPVTIESHNITYEQFKELLQGKMKENNIESGWRYLKNSNDLTILEKILDQYKRVKDYQNPQEFYDRVLQVTGYDGAKYSGNGAYANGRISYVAFNSNQVKNIDNTNPTSSPDIRYSLSQDSTGKELSKEQQEYFKDSKVRDSEGRLQAVYHGTTHPGFTVFKPSTSDSSVFGKYKFNDYDVNYFTASRETARGYTDIGVEENGNVYETYLDIKNPYTVENSSTSDIKSWRNIKDNNIRQFETEYYDRFESKWNTDKSISENLDEINADLYPFNCELRLNDGYYELYRLAENDGWGEELLEYVGQNDNTSELFTEGLKENIYGENFDDYRYTSDGIVRWILTENSEGQNYDGIIIPNITDNGTKGSIFGEPTTDYVTFKSNQIKNIDNTNPTMNEDIRFSLAQDNIGDYVQIDTDQEQFDNLTLEQQRKKAKEVLKNKFNGLINDEVKLSAQYGIKEFTNPTEKISNTKKRTKYRLSTELDNLYKVAKKINNELIPNNDSHKYHEFAKDGWNYYYARFKFGDKEFIGKINEGVTDGQPSFYDVTDIYTPLEYKKMTESKSLSSNESTLIQSFLEDNISQNEVKVNYSLSNDSQGRELSQQQQEYFKDSKVRTPDGSLRVMYRGGNQEFTVFDRNKANPGGQQGNGFYFTTAKSHAEQYGKANEYYLNITNPLNYSYSNDYGRSESRAITKEQLYKLVDEMWNNEDYSLENYGYGKTTQDIVDMLDSNSSDYELLEDLNTTAVGNMAEFLEYVNDTIGTNYDGIITDYETVVLNSNQVKNIDNTNPTSSPDIRYSLSQDSTGKELSKEQQEYFKDSKVRDSEGRLLEVYHGTPNAGFTIYDSNRLGETTGAEDTSLGFHLTDNEQLASFFSGVVGDEAYNEAKQEIYKKYNIDANENLPFDMGAKVNQEIADLAEEKAKQKGEVKHQYINITKPLSVFADYGIDESQLARDLVYAATGEEDISNVSDYYESNEDMLLAIQQNFDDELAQLKDELSKPESIERIKEMGYDGLILPMTNKDKATIKGNGNEYVVFNSNQIKNTDNTNPTLDNDIRYSLSQSEELNNYIENNNYKFDTNGSLEANNLTDKQVKNLTKAYNKNGYTDVTEDFVRNRLKDGFKIPRAVADTYIQTELGGKPQIDTTQVFEDADGNQLTQEQVDFYKDSDVRDIRGRLIPVYHTTDAEFTIFNPNAQTKNGKKYGKGLYFSITPENYGNNEMKLYLNAKEGEYKYIQDKGYYIVQEPNMVKNVDNKAPTSNPDIRYSLSPSNEMIDNTTGEKVTFDAQEVQTQLPTNKTLMAIHNLNADKLNGVLDLGGFPYPSIAITKPGSISHEGYGDISVIFNEDTINPEINSKNKVYSRDAYTPRFPTLEYKVSSNEAKKIREVIGDYDYRNPLPKDKYISDAYSIMDNLEDNINRSGLERTLDDIKNSDAMKYVYLKNTNQPFEVETKAENYSSQYDNSTLQRFLDNYNGEFDYSNVSSADIDNYLDNMLEAYRQQMLDKYTASGMDEKAINIIIERNLERFSQSFAAKDNFLRAAYQLQKYGLDKQVLDTEATKAKLNDVINQEEYNKWIDDLFSNIIEKKGLRNNKDYYTASGTPRSFEQLHDEYTLDNVVKILDALNDTGEESGFFTGISEIAGNASIRFNTMQDIKANENLLETIGSEEYSQMLDNIGDRLSTIQESIMERENHNSDNYFIARDNMSSAIADAARIFGEGKKIDAKKVQKMLKDYGFEATIEESQQILDMFKEMRELPTQYFEAKPKRAVGFDEIGAVVIPSNVSEDLKQRLIDNNIQYTEYNPEIEGDRQAKINEYQQFMFSLGLQSDENMPNSPTGFERTKRVETYNDYLDYMNLPTTQATQSGELPFFEANEDMPQTFEERMSQIRQKLADDRFSKIMEKQTFKSIKDSTKMAKSYLDFDTKQTAEFKKQISKLAKLPKDNLIKAKNYNQLKDIVRQYANKDINFVNEELKSAQKDVRNTELIVSEELKKQITDWSDFRKSSGLKIRTGQKSNVDVVYQELLDTYPGMLDSTITNYADQLQELKEFVKRDNKYVQHFELNEDSINQITNHVWEKLSNNALTIQEIDDIQNDITAKLENRTREVVRQDLLDKMGLTEQDIAQGKDITSLGYQMGAPVRVNEKVFGAEVGRKINEATTGFVKQQEAQKIRFLNQERNDIRQLGIKARSKESAAVQKFGEKQYVNDKGELVQYTEQDLRNEFKDEATIQRIKNAADTLRQKYDKYIDMINSSLVEMGYDPIPKRQDYFKHFMELEDKLSQFGWTFSKENIMKEELPTDINGLTDQFKPGKNYFASALQRKGLKTTYDAITGIDTYLEGASNLIFHTESIQRYRAISKLIRDTYGQQHGLENLDLMTPEEAQQRVQDVYDNKLTRYAAWLDEQANALAGKKGGIDRAVERLLGRKVYTFLNAMKKQVGSNMTGFNVRSALTNFASAIQGASKTQKLAALQGFTFALKNYRNLDPLIAKSDFLATRFGSDSLSKKTWQKISEAGQVFMNATDRFTSLQIWGGKYYEGLHNGLTEQAAIKQADNFASRIMGDRSKGQTAEIFNSKTLGFLTQFQLEVNNQWQSMFHDSKMEYKENPGLKAGLHIANQLGQLYVASWVFNNLMKAITGSDVMFDPIDLLMGLFNPDDDDETLEERATGMIGKIVNQLPMASIFTGGRIPLSEAFKGVETGFKYATGQTDQYGNNFTLDDVKNDFIGSFAYYLLPTGYGQIKKTTQGLGMYTHELPGSYTDSGRLRFEADTSPLGILQAGLFGQYASGDAREYFDKGLQPLTEKKVQEARDANLPIKEYRKIDEGISKAKQEAKEKGESQAEAQYDYIYNLPLDMDTRNKLLNSRLNTSDNVTDDNGYIKYTDGSKTYWYDEENNVVYNSKYRKMDNIKISQLEKYSNVKDISDYGKYGSLAEFNYANDNPTKYLTSQQIAKYDDYVKYKDDIAAIKDNYNDGTTAGKNKAKQKVFNYIDSLKLNKYKKLMLYKMAGGYSIKSYKNEMAKYINSLKLSKKEKEQIYKELIG